MKRYTVFCQSWPLEYPEEIIEAATALDAISLYARRYGLGRQDVATK
jgi:hypothetical protein